MVRFFVPLVGVVGCFSPHIPPELVTEAGLPPGDAGGDAAVVRDGGPDADLRTHFEYPADVAECVDPAAPDPAVCRTANVGSGNDLFQMSVDLEDAGVGHPWVAYIRFAVDAEFAGKTVTSVKLRVVATDDTLAAAPETGDVFAVAPFVGADLTGTAPAKVGARLAGSQGAVDTLDIVEFPLPVASVTAGTPAHFGLFPTNTNGAIYWNSSGPNPPRLIIDTQ
jgi:hypothetical protein